jgi:hypothetical protein
MERITIVIETGTLAFAREPNAEVTRILRHAADLIGLGQEFRHLRDANGNVVGRIKIESST